MTKDDYHVIVYKILAYLYSCLKKGENPEKEYLLCDGALFNINHTYWLYIIENLANEGYIEGLSNIRVGNGYYLNDQLPYCRITPRGIDYLCDNSFISKAKEFLKSVKDIAPFI